jgi:uncharacterized membrane protein YccC
VLAPWFGSLIDRFFASDHGLIRFRFALRAVLAVSLTALALGPTHAVPLTALLLGCVAAMVCSTSMRSGTLAQRVVNIVLFGITMLGSLTLASALAPYLITGDAVFVVVLFIAVYLRRFDQLGFSVGMAAFQAYFFAMFLHAGIPALPPMYLSVGVGLVACAIMALVVFRDDPRRAFLRINASLRAQAARLVDELAGLLEAGSPLEDPGRLPRPVARQANRIHQTTLQIEDDAESLELDPRWQRQLVDVELSADRLARAAVRALGAGLDADTRARLAADLRGLHRFVERDPAAALTVDTDELLRRIARADITRADIPTGPSTPEQHIELVHRAIRELLLSIAQLRRLTVESLRHRAARGPDRIGEAGSARPPEEPARPEETGGSAEPAKRELAPSTRAAIQASIGGALAITGGELLSAQRWYWAVIASFLIFAGTTTRGDLLVKGWRRLWGTLLGIVAGTILAEVLRGDPTVNVVVLLTCVFLAFYTLRVSYSTMTFFITIMLGMLYDILGTFSANVLLLRLAETAVGVTASAIAAMLVLPRRTASMVLADLRAFLTALRSELADAERLLVDADQVSVISATREVDRTAGELCTAIEPMLHRLNPGRIRRGQARRLTTLTQEAALAARNLARAAEPGALAGLPEATETLHRLMANIDVLLAATENPKPAELESGPALSPRVDVRKLAEANPSGTPDRIQLLHLRRVLNTLDRLDKTLLGMAAPLAQAVSIPKARLRPDAEPAATQAQPSLAGRRPGG